MGCDSVSCFVLDCWWSIVADVGHFFALVWPVLAVYGLLYAAGATAFLINLRVRAGESGRLEVPWNSWAFMLASPYRYGRIKDAVETYGSLKEAEVPSKWVSSTSICSIYARMFNMLLFVWPVLLVYFAVGTVLGTVFFGVILGVGYARPDFTRDGWFRSVYLRTPADRWQSLLTIPFIWYVVVGLVILITFHFLALVKVLLCIAPVLAFIAAVVFLTRKVVMEHDDSETTVGALTEYAAARKEKFCKVVDIK